MGSEDIVPMLAEFLLMSSLLMAWALLRSEQRATATAARRAEAPRERG